MEGAVTERERQIAAIAPAVEADIAEIEEYNLPEIVRALRPTYGAMPGPTRRLELHARLPETVTLRKACENSRVRSVVSRN